MLGIDESLIPGDDCALHEVKASHTGLRVVAIPSPLVDISVPIYVSRICNISVPIRELDDRFIEEALAVKKNGTWSVKPDWRNPAFVQRITPILNQAFNTNIPKAFYAEKVEWLFERQNCFQFIIGHTNVYWHQRSNEITYMNEETFTELATLTPLAHTYKAKGEPQYKKLCALFTDE
ncbi:hypothetical protein C2S52_001784 [Perilla frutescens var. hirtella]|nr:hypothetical protein C2S52_001784 [Perilla frutescens var. hirtella]